MVGSSDVQCQLPCKTLTVPTIDCLQHPTKTKNVCFQPAIDLSKISILPFAVRMPNASSNKLSERIDDDDDGGGGDDDVDDEYTVSRRSNVCEL